MVKDIERAILESERSFTKVRMMKELALRYPPKSAGRPFPYPHRTVAEVSGRC